MTDRRKLDDPLAVPLTHALAAGLDRSGRECPDAETLALYFDRALAAPDSARWELHFSACARCQQQLAAMARMETASAAAGPAALPSASGVSWLWNWRWLAPAAAALGALAIWVVVQNTAPTSTREPLSARNEAPAPKIATASPAEPSADREQGKDQAAAAPSRRSDLGPAATAAGGKRTPELRAQKPERGEQLDQGALKSAPSTAAKPAKIGVLADQKKDESAAERAIQVDALKAKEEQTRETETKLAALESRAAPQPVAQAAPPAAPQQAAQAPQAAANEPATPVARDELTKSQAEPLREETSAFAVESDAKAKSLRRSRVAGGYFAIRGVGSKLVWRLGPAGSIERSTDAGATWQRQASGVEADLLAGSAPSATVCWAVGRGGAVLRTSDGSVWTQLGSPTSQDLVAIVAVDANRATVTTADGKRYATADGGRTWRSL